MSYDDREDENDMYDRWIDQQDQDFQDDHNTYVEIQRERDHEEWQMPQ